MPKDIIKKPHTMAVLIFLINAEVMKAGESEK